MNCPSCGALLDGTEPRCRYCGSVLVQPSVPEKEPDVFKLLRESKDLAQMFLHIPSAGKIGSVVAIVFGLIFTLIAVALIPPKELGVPLAARLVPVIFVLVGLAITGGGVWGLVKLVRSGWVRVPARVVGERDEQSGSSSGRSQYYLTIENEKGERKAYPVDGKLVGELEKGDVGIAYIKGGRLLDFKRVPLPKS